MLEIRGYIKYMHVVSVGYQQLIIHSFHFFFYVVYFNDYTLQPFFLNIFFLNKRNLFYMSDLEIGVCNISERRYYYSNESRMNISSYSDLNIFWDAKILRTREIGNIIDKCYFFFIKIMLRYCVLISKIYLVNLR